MKLLFFIMVLAMAIWSADTGQPNNIDNITEKIDENIMNRTRALHLGQFVSCERQIHEDDENRHSSRRKQRKLCFKKYKKCQRQAKLPQKKVIVQSLCSMKSGTCKLCKYRIHLYFYFQHIDYCNTVIPREYSIDSFGRLCNAYKDVRVRKSCRHMAKNYGEIIIQNLSPYEQPPDTLTGEICMLPPDQPEQICRKFNACGQQAQIHEDVENRHSSSKKHRKHCFKKYKKCQRQVANLAKLPEKKNFAIISSCQKKSLTCGVCQYVIVLYMRFIEIDSCHLDYSSDSFERLCKVHTNMKEPCLTMAKDHGQTIIQYLKHHRLPPAEPYDICLLLNECSDQEYSACIKECKETYGRGWMSGRCEFLCIGYTSCKKKCKETHGQSWLNRPCESTCRDNVYRINSQKPNEK